MVEARPVPGPLGGGGGLPGEEVVEVADGADAELAQLEGGEGGGVDDDVDAGALAPGAVFGGLVVAEEAAAHVDEGVGGAFGAGAAAPVGVVVAAGGEAEGFGDDGTVVALEVGVEAAAVADRVEVQGGGLGLGRFGVDEGVGLVDPVAYDGDGGVEVEQGECGHQGGFVLGEQLDVVGPHLVGDDLDLPGRHGALGEGPGQDRPLSEAAGGVDRLGQCTQLGGCRPGRHLTHDPTQGV